MSNIPVPAPILINSQTAENWRFFKSQWDNDQVATELNKKDYNNSLPRIIGALNNHFTPQKNVIYERYIFITERQITKLTGQESEDVKWYRKYERKRKRPKLQMKILKT
ncbi:hypothetical protein LAZ67_2005459 [Cordylochernes scorpioides]|uniref:Uncharacterized protein n=1 Tax=Cordylochernes scorpioides TaxID=51811 RepID=A0ABY6K793_9ARAC|nr:hypothetical protein LAZ67_2005459 [Cordylochernes scorpioides]